MDSCFYLSTWTQVKTEFIIFTITKHHLENKNSHFITKTLLSLLLLHYGLALIPTCTFTAGGEGFILDMTALY